MADDNFAAYTASCEALHDRDSDEKLNQTIHQKLDEAQVYMASNDFTRAQLMLAEVRACQNLLARNKRAFESRQEDAQKANKAWPEIFMKLKQRAVLNLPTAASPNGQLVAAILEEKSGKTADDLHYWCDELEMLDDSEFAALLDGLVKEGIIELHEDGTYWLKCICSENLLSEDPVAHSLAIVRAWKGYGEEYDNEEDEACYKAILNYLNLYGASPLDPGVLLYDDGFIYYYLNLFPEDVRKNMISDLTRKINLDKKEKTLFHARTDLSASGALKFYITEAGCMYYFNMLGMTEDIRRNKV